METEAIIAKSMSMKAAADFLGPGAIEVPMFETEITDMVRRSSAALQRFKSKRATGHPHRYLEQTAIATGASVDPRNLSSSPTNPTRVERPAFIKAEIAQTNIGLFDKEVTEQQGQFESVVAKDIDDIINAVEVWRATMLWAGTDTSMSSPTTLQWMGALEQIGTAGGAVNLATIAPGTSIIDGLKTVVANLKSQVGFVVRPSAIYLNDTLGDLIDQEAKASHIELKTVEVVAGVTTEAISTRQGKLPLIGDPYMPTDTTGKYGFSNPPVGYKNYYAAIIMEEETEIPYISGKTDDPKPRLFQLGLTGNLSGQFVAVKFDTLVIKGASYAHALVCIQRP
jgi:hypothetical protein